MNRILSALVFLSFPACIYAQRADGSLPYTHQRAYTDVVTERLVVPRPEAGIQAIRQSESTDKVYDFGVAVPVTDNLLTGGQIENLPDGKRLVRQEIYAPEAYGINLNFLKFNPGKSGKLWIYSADRQMVLGAFDQYSVTPGIPFATSPVRGELVTLEFVYDPAEKDVAVELAEVVYEFADIFEVSRGFGGSGSCHKNVNCPEYADQADQKRAVAMILTANNVRWCSGSMVNNTAQDGKPYFLTARHCNTTANSIFMFNYESPDCSNIDGPTNQSIQGCTVRVNWEKSDVVLVELSSPPPANYFTYFAGWNASSAPSDSVYGIHHPKGDIKKISTDWDAVSGSTYQAGDTALSYWRITSWNIGSTEGGSSGSPLFNRQGQIIGQLRGGQASCANTLSDYYGRFNYSWEGLNTPETALKFWLDPGNTGQTQLNGADFNAPTSNYDLMVAGVSGPDSVICQDSVTWVVTVRNNGAFTAPGFSVTLILEDGPDVYPIKTVTQPLPFGNSVPVSFTGIYMPNGLQEVKARVVWTNPTVDENPANDTYSRMVNHIDGDQITVTFTNDLFSGQTGWGIYKTDGSPVYISPAAVAFEEQNKSLCLPTGCYIFRVTDSGNNGICCQYGEGSFQITGGNGSVLVKNESFSDLYEKKFCVPGLPDDWDKLFEIYPNPSPTLINVKLQSYAEGYEGELLIFSADGKVLVNQRGTLKYLNTFDVSDWARGVYFVRVSVGKLKSVQKFVKN